MDKTFVFAPKTSLRSFFGFLEVLKLYVLVVVLTAFACMCGVTKRRPLVGVVKI